MNYMAIAKQNIRHLSRTLRGKKDLAWPFYQFERGVRTETWKKHEEYRQWAITCADGAAALEQADRYEASDDPVVVQGYSLARNARQQFQNKYRNLQRLRVLIHVPPSSVSPGGHSLFNNMMLSFQYLGVSVRSLEWNQPIDISLSEFGPNVILTSDHGAYLSRIQWSTIAEYRKRNDLMVGLTASLHDGGNTPLQDRLNWAKRNSINFYYSFHAPEHIHERPEYGQFIDRGYRIHCIEFGANPLLYYPVPGIRRDIDFVFLASSNQDKWLRYFAYLPQIVSTHAGMIDGPGWTQLNAWTPPAAHRFLYARAKVGINLHIDDSIEWASELNERTYILAACGVPQLIDKPKLLYQRFRAKSLFVAASPREYTSLFQRILDDPGEAQQRALEAQKDVFAKHTTFHRAEQFITFLSGLTHPGAYSGNAAY